MDDVFVILYNNAFMNIKERFMAAATSEAGAVRWMTDEINGVFLHPDDPPKYPPGLDVSDYLETKIFEIRRVGLFR